MRRILAVIAAALCTACYEYREPPAGFPATGTRVSARLSDSGSMVLARSVGPGVEAVEGLLLRSTDTDIELSVTAIRQRDGMEESWRGERVTVPRQLLVDLHERKFSRSRTTVFSGMALVGAFILREAFNGSGGGSPPIVGSGPTGPR